MDPPVREHEKDAHRDPLTGQGAACPFEPVAKRARVLHPLELGHPVEGQLREGLLAQRIVVRGRRARKQPHAQELRVPEGIRLGTLAVWHHLQPTPVPGAQHLPALGVVQGHL
ncbi:MAG: hypothetical protein C4303_07975 [candidate division GAL15 bacterium]